MTRQQAKQMDFTAYLERIKPHPVKIMGFCDDAYCPECGTYLPEWKIKNCIVCPECGLGLDWTPWHQANDEEDEDDNDH